LIPGTKVDALRASHCSIEFGAAVNGIDDNNTCASDREGGRMYAIQLSQRSPTAHQLMDNASGAM
jgi:hypothetical protein